MKTILLLRHAKSDWGEGDLADFDRPLAKRGLKDAPRMGQALTLFACIPDKIVSSPARRARQTAELVAEACGYSKKSIQWEPSFYEGDSDDLTAALRRLPAEVERVLLVGHNPGMEETAAVLMGVDEDEAAVIRLPTAGLVCLEVDIDDWALLRPGQVVLRWFLIPKLAQVLQKDGDELSG
jgi:phosphohistidine phosphatase